MPSVQIDDTPQLPIGNGAALAAFPKGAIAVLVKIGTHTKPIRFTEA